MSTHCDYIIVAGPTRQVVQSCSVFVDSFLFSTGSPHYKPLWFFAKIYTTDKRTHVESDNSNLNYIYMIY